MSSSPSSLDREITRGLCGARAHHLAPSAGEASDDFTSFLRLAQPGWTSQDGYTISLDATLWPLVLIISD